MGYIEFFDRLTGMMESIGTHLSYLSEYSNPAFQESEKLQKVRCGAGSRPHYGSRRKRVNNDKNEGKKEGKKEEKNLLLHSIR